MQPLTCLILFITWQSGDFQQWENFLYKNFLEMPTGFTKLYCFEFHMGSVAIKRLHVQDPDDVPVTKDLLRDTENEKRLILRTFQSSS